MRSDDQRPGAGLVETVTARRREDPAPARGTALSRDDEALSREMELAQVTLASIGEGVIRTDAKRRIDYMNPAGEQLTGWTLVEAAGREITDVYQVTHETSRRPRRDPVAECLAAKQAVVPPGLFTLRGRGGDELVISDSVSPIHGPDGRVLGAVVVFRDLTRMRGLEREMVYLTSHDTLTGLLNRQEFEIYLEAALEAARDLGTAHALLFLDLWEFKLINDGFGLVAGDELLRQIAELLRAEIGERAILGRFGGDNFTILLENSVVEEAHEVARGLRRTFRDFRFTWGGQHLEVGASVGVVPITARTESVLQVLKAADAASYLAQRSGRNKIHLYVSDDAAVVERYGRFDWVRRIRNCLTEDRFCLYHQEIRPLKPESGPPLQEILLRLVDENGDHVLPDNFIPVAEDHDLAPLLDRWVVRQVLKVLSRDGGALAGKSVSVNLSGHSLSDESFVDDLSGYLKASPVAAERIYFEITETAAVAHLSRARNFIDRLKELGCRFILDDFGSGFASFSYLRNLPVDYLKIDGEFVRSMEADKIRRAMVGSINEIGQVMGLRTIAEWVETEATYAMLEELGVDYVQGYWIHRPEPLT